MDDTSSLVKLIVKASNQQYDDQTIECQPHWTVRKLKEHLFDVYPSKPRPDDQKLIYSGQLLKDKLILKDILRHYEGVQSQVHTFHLVYTPKFRYPAAFSSLTSQQKPKQQITPAASTTNDDGLRQRHNIQRTTSSVTTANQNSTVTSATASTSAMQNNSIPQLTTATAIAGTSSIPVINTNCPTSSSSSSSLPPLTRDMFGNAIPSYNPMFTPNEYMLVQQAAMQNWMQQAYIQYMNQYMSLLSTGIRPETLYMQNQTGTTTTTGGMANVGGLPQMPYMPQNFPFSMMNANVLPNLSTDSSINPPSSHLSAGNVGAATSVSVPPPPPPVQQQREPQPQQNQPRFPNLMEDDIQENRDWLDVFYSVGRLMVLLTLVYLYSSPIRCLAVFVIGMAIYLYHTSYFRVNRQHDDNNNNGAQVRQRQNDEQQPQQQNIQPNLRQPNNESDEINSTVSNSTDSTDEIASEQGNSTERPINGGNMTTTNERASDANVSNVNDDADGTSMIAFLKTFVVSFIVSLLPETPPV